MSKTTSVATHFITIFIYSPILISCAALGAMQVPNKMVGIEGDTRPVSGPNSPVNIEMTKKRRMNWDEVAGGNQNEANATVANNNNNPNQGLVKDHLQMDRRKMGEWNLMYINI